MGFFVALRISLEEIKWLNIITDPIRKAGNLGIWQNFIASAKYFE